MANTAPEDVTATIIAFLTVKERNQTSGTELVRFATGGSMRTTEQINSFWELAREQSVDGEVLRRRVVVIGAITVGFCGLLLAIGLGVVVVVLPAGIVASIGVATLLTVWPRLRSFGVDGIAYVRDRMLAARAQLVPLWRRAPHLGRGVGQTARATALRFGSGAARLDPRCEAIQLNAIGTQQRRGGRYDEAVECHREALEILRRLGDRRAVALTQSNLALALSHAGDDSWAVGLFEEAAATLRELGDEEDEARVMANLGVTHRRHGRPGEGADMLELALSKLSPASSAYEAIEAELRRAG